MLPHFCSYHVQCSLGLLLDTEAPVMTPNGVDFSFFFFLQCSKHCTTLCDIYTLKHTLVLQIQKQDALEAAVEADDKGKLEQHLQGDEAQVCPSSSSACFGCSCMLSA